MSDLVISYQNRKTLQSVTVNNFFNMLKDKIAEFICNFLYQIFLQYFNNKLAT